MRQVYIHAGAHRTGTSSFQLCLAENRLALETAGYAFAYPGRDGAPGGRLRLQLPRPRHGVHRVKAFADAIRVHLNTIADPDRPLILSEENIPGPMRHFYDGRFFPASAKRLATLREALGRPKHLLYILRPYAELYVSAYRKRAEDNPVPDFATLRDAFLGMDRGWPELIAEMRDILEPERLTVLAFANRGSSVSLLQRLVTDAPEGLIEPQTQVNLSATDTALVALQQKYRAGEVLKRRSWQKIIRNHADDRAPTGFAAFNDADVAQLDKTWRRDLTAVAELSGVDFVG